MEQELDIFHACKVERGISPRSLDGKPNGFNLLVTPRLYPDSMPIIDRFVKAQEYFRKMYAQIDKTNFAFDTESELSTSELEPESYDPLKIAAGIVELSPKVCISTTGGIYLVYQNRRQPTKLGLNPYLSTDQDGSDFFLYGQAFILTGSAVKFPGDANSHPREFYSIKGVFLTDTQNQQELINNAGRYLASGGQSQFVIDYSLELVPESPF